MNNRKPINKGKKKRTFIPKPNHLGGDVRVTVSSNTPAHIKAAFERNMARYNNPTKVEVK